MSRFSVLTPNFNHAEYLEQCIESVVLQSRPPDEYLIIDDGSTDESSKIISHFARLYPYIKYSKHQKNCGFAQTLGELLRAASGDRIVVLAADDALFPGVIEGAELIDREFPDVAMIIAKHVIVPQKWSYWGEFPSDCPISERNLKGYLNSKEFLSAVLTEPNGLMAFGMPAFILKKYIQIEEFCAPELNHLNDVFGRLCVGARGGAYFMDMMGQAFRSVEGSMSRSCSVEEWIDTLQEWYRIICKPEYRGLFGENYAEIYFSEIMKSLDISPPENLSEFFKERRRASIK